MLNFISNICRTLSVTNVTRNYTVPVASFNRLDGLTCLPRASRATHVKSLSSIKCTTRHGLITLRSRAPVRQVSIVRSRAIKSRQRRISPGVNSPDCRAEWTSALRRPRRLGKSATDNARDDYRRQHVGRKEGRKDLGRVPSREGLEISGASGSLKQHDPMRGALARSRVQWPWNNYIGSPSSPLLSDTCSRSLNDAFCDVIWNAFSMEAARGLSLISPEKTEVVLYRWSEHN